MSITEKSRATVVAAQALLAEMIADVAARDPEMAQAVAFSVERGALFEVQVLFDLDRPHITLSCVDGGGRGERRTVSTVKLAVPASH